MNGKGDTRRPGNDKAFAENYDRIFGKKAQEEDSSMNILGEPVTAEDIEAYLSKRISY